MSANRWGFIELTARPSVILRRRHVGEKPVKPGYSARAYELQPHSIQWGEWLCLGIRNCVYK